MGETTHGFATRAIHVGQDPDPQTGAVAVPVYQTSTYAQTAPGEAIGWDYARTGNPTRDAVQAALASLEGTDTAVSYASGLAAIDAVIRLTDTPTTILLGDDAYGGTHRMLSQVSAKEGRAVTTVDLTDLDALEKALESDVSMVILESPTNPMLKIFDIKAIAERTHAAGALLVVDNTFATPYHQQPATLGADLVVHSATKYLGGHSDVVHGIVATTHEHAEKLRWLANATGGVPGPWDCFLVLRGIKTLALRMERHSANAMTIAQFLESHEAVAHVLYPGLATHPNHDIAAAQMQRGFGGMVSARLRGGQEACNQMLKKTSLFFLAESLGGVESLIEHPGVMTHLSVEGTALEVPDDLIRLSVGIEDVDDLIADLEQALA